MQKIEYNLTLCGIDPRGVRDAGIQGDHNKYALVFQPDAALWSDIWADVPQNHSVRYRIDATDGCGGFHASELLEPDETAHAVTYPLPSSITQAGGKAQLFLIVSEVDACNREVRILYSYPAILQFRSSTAGGEAEEVYKVQFSGALQEVRKALEAFKNVFPIDTDRIADKAVAMSKIADQAVSGAKIADHTIGGAKILAAAISGNHLVSKTVRTGELADKAVTTSILADRSVTAEKLADGLLPENPVTAPDALSAGELLIGGGGRAAAPSGYKVFDGAPYLQVTRENTGNLSIGLLPAHNPAKTYTFSLEARQVSGGEAHISPAVSTIDGKFLYHWTTGGGSLTADAVYHGGPYRHQRHGAHPRLSDPRGGRFSQHPPDRPGRCGRIRYGGLETKRHLQNRSAAA